VKTLNFYHQKRKDGGLRTGVESNGERVMESFKPGRIPPDSALKWFVDVRCRGRRLPSDPEAIRHWLLEHGDEIQRCLEMMAGELKTGIDPGWPFARKTASNGVTIEIVCSAVRRLASREIGKVLLDLKNAWRKLIASLPAFHAEIAA